MFVLSCNILIGNLAFGKVNEVSVVRDFREIGDTATIKLPSLKNRMEDAIQVGDAVSITLGYKGVQSNEEFLGYVSKVHPKTPFEIECEDHIFNLKRTPISNTWRATNLKEIISYLVSEVNAANDTNITLHEKIPDIEMTKFRFNKTNAAQALQILKDEHGLVAYFRANSLYVGLAYFDAQPTVQYSTKSNVISDDLTFRKAEDVKIKVNAIGITSDNKKIELDTPVGDADGDERTLFFYNITDKTKLKELAEAKLNLLKYDGMEGSLTTFLTPYATHGMVAELADPDYNDGRTGSYFIDSVEVKFGLNGARRVIELGPKASTNG